MTLSILSSHPGTAGSGQSGSNHASWSRLLAAAAALGVILPAVCLSNSASAQAGSATPAPTAADSSVKTYVETLPGSVVKVNMVGIPAGSIKIGTKVVPIKPFWIADTETTWEAYDVFIASGEPTKAYDMTKFAPDAIARPSKSYILPDLGWGHHGWPAINISILSATMYCRWLSSKTGFKYRLPTEAEWEYACRAGSTAPLTKADVEKQAWYVGNAAEKTHPVGKKAPNAWKLYDMLGNAGEWAIDLAGKPVLCGPTLKTAADKVSPSVRAYFDPSWQETDPQLPKSRWWLSDGFFCGFRVVREP